MLRFIASVLFLAVAFAVAPMSSFAQLLDIFEPVLMNEQSSPPRGYLQSGTYNVSGFDDVSINSGVVTISVPITSFARGRGGSGFDLSLTYNSRAFDSKVVYQGNVTAPDGPLGDITPQGIIQITSTGAWRYSYEYGLEAEKLGTGPDGGYTGCTTSVNFGHGWRFWLNTPDGGRSPLHLRGQDELEGYYKYGLDGDVFLPNCDDPDSLTVSRLTLYTSDGSFLKVEIDRDGTDWTQKQWTIYFPDGRRVLGRHDQADEIIDANGNRILIEPLGANSFRLKEVLGNSTVENNRVIEIVRSGSADTITQRGFNNQLATWTVTWSSTSGFNYWCTDQINSSDPQGQPHTCQYSGHQAVTNISLPAAPDAPPPYTFSYNNPGDEISHVALPSTATIDYVFDANQSADPPYWFWVVKRRLKTKTLSHDGPTSPDTWTYNGACPDNGTANITVLNPNGGQTVHQCQGDLITKVTEPSGDTIDRVWAQNVPQGVFNHAGGLNNYIEKEMRTIAGSSSRSSVRTFKYNKNGQVTQRDECAWVSAGATDCTNPIRRQVWQYHVDAPDAATTPSPSDDKSYWREQISPLSASDGRRLDAVKRQEIRQGTSTVVAATEFDYDTPLTRGNVVQERRWASPKGGVTTPLTAGNSVVRLFTYSSSGNILTTDIRPGLRATFAHDTLDLYPESVTIAGLTMDLDYDEYSGRLASRSDPNNLTATFAYDKVNRLTSVSEAGQRTTSTSYKDFHRIVITKQDLASIGDGSIQTATHYDALGRVTLVRQSDGSPLGETSTTDGIKIRTVYRTESNASCQMVSNPYRTGSESTMGWRRTRSDQNGRPVETASFPSEPSNCTTTGGRTGWTTMSYDATAEGRKVAVSEKANDGDKNRDTFFDPLSRLTRVVEYPGAGTYTTTYGYNALDNLSSVTQGSQSRQFVYDSLGRLETATNPESGTIGYTYYDDGLLNTKTDDRNGTVTHTYDALDRLVTTVYSGGGSDFNNTPDVLRCYDGNLYNSATHACVSNPASLPAALQSLVVTGPTTGQLTSVGNSVSATYFPKFNNLHQIQSSTQYTDANRFDFAYSYNLADGLSSETYPSGRVLAYGYDGAGRINQVSGAYESVPTTYAQSFSYAPHGGLLSVALNNSSLTETMQFNSHLQPTQIAAGGLLSLTFNYGSINNGNVQTQTISRPSISLNATQTYIYDGVNRLDLASESGSAWSRDYAYDAYGNRAATGTGITGGSPTPQSTGDFSLLNRISAASYDAAGNMTGLTGIGTMVYDANNKMTAYDNANPGLAGAGQYFYDGEGNRVKRAMTDPSGTTTTLYVYDAMGKLAAEYSDEPPAGAAETLYRTTDHLGSTRLVTNASGQIADGGCSDYFPFGQRIDSGIGSRSSIDCYDAVSPFRQRFTGKERDDESGLDFFGARYFSSPQGRFTSPDKPFADQQPEDPQSWNLYGYVRNNPLVYVDPSGDACFALNSDSGYCQRANLYGRFDGLVRHKTRFFAAASAATQALANVAVPGLGRAGTSPETRAFLESTGEGLQTVNAKAVNQILSGEMGGTGPDLDAKMVHLEQTAVQKGLDQLKTIDASAYGAAIKEINGLLNEKSTTPANALAALGGFFLPSDEAYAQVLAGVRKSLGRDINFANQGDREAIGNALVRHIRETGGCEITDNRAHGCR